MEDKERSPVLIIVAILVLIVLAGISIMNGSEPTGKFYSSNGFYKREIKQLQDPKAAYSSMQKLQSQLYACRVSMSKANTETGQKSNRYWIVNGKRFPDDLSQFSYHEGDLIVAPGEGTFVNRNTDEEDDGSISIKIKVGSDWEITFTNVSAWWCHYGKTETEQHTVTYGYNAKFSSFSNGHILGEATSKTEVKVWHNGAESSLQDLYGIDTTEEQTVD